jgi:hypothetical protein
MQEISKLTEQVDLLYEQHKEKMCTKGVLLNTKYRFECGAARCRIQMDTARNSNGDFGTSYFFYQ